MNNRHKNFKKLGINGFLEESSSVLGEQFISIGNEFHSGSHFRIEAISKLNSQTFTPSIEIGDNVSIQDFCHIGCIEKICIGSGTMIASRVYISDHNHGNITAEDLKLAPAKRPLVSKPVIIGRNVWLGEGCCILPGVTLGDNVIVGANAVVTHSFPSNRVIAGVPARVIKQL
ncbi:acyltransferase [Candidatus Saccharibacteria bacterium]|nr:acyltransferase [Candidatus Saccharibacteria bacterium]